MSQWHKRNKKHLRAYNRDYWSRPVNNARRNANREKKASASPRFALGAGLAHAVKRVKTENPVTLDELMSMWRAQLGLCAVSGVIMTWRQGRITSTTISIDRIDCERGYSSDNVRLVCYAVNAFKGRMSDVQMLDMARAIVAKADADDPRPTWKPYLVHSEVA